MSCSFQVLQCVLVIDFGWSLLQWCCTKVLSICLWVVLLTFQLCQYFISCAVMILGCVVCFFSVWFVVLCCCLGSVTCMCECCWCCVAVWSIYTSTNLHIAHICDRLGFCSTSLIRLSSSCLPPCRKLCLVNHSTEHFWMELHC